MLRRFGLVLTLVASMAHAAERDPSREVQEAANRPVFGPAPIDSEITRKVGELAAQLQVMDARISKLESLVQNQTALELLKEVEAVKGEISRLRGQAEMQTHRLDSLAKRQTDLYADLDKRLEDINKQVKLIALQPPPPSAPPVVPVISPPLALVPSTQVSNAPTAGVAPTPAQAAEDALVESKRYEAALSQFKAGNYPAAVTGFKSFLKAHPASGLAPNAQYWLGYSYYALKDYKAAIAQQKKLITAYPQSAKVPDALLTIANSHGELNEPESARKALEEIVTKYPGTNAARLAARRLAALK